MLRAGLFNIHTSTFGARYVRFSAYLLTILKNGDIPSIGIYHRLRNVRSNLDVVLRFAVYASSIWRAQVAAAPANSTFSVKTGLGDPRLDEYR